MNDDDLSIEDARAEAVLTLARRLAADLRRNPPAVHELLRKMTHHQLVGVASAALVLARTGPIDRWWQTDDGLPAEIRHRREVLLGKVS